MRGNIQQLLVAMVGAISLACGSASNDAVHQGPDIGVAAHAGASGAGRSMGGSTSLPVGGSGAIVASTQDGSTAGYSGASSIGIIAGTSASETAGGIAGRANISNQGGSALVGPCSSACAGDVGRATSGGGGSGGANIDSAGQAGEYNPSGAGRASADNAGGFATSGAGNVSPTAGTAGQSCVVGNYPSCDDHNPCTLDTLEADCTCQHPAVADATRCDDQKICTQDDTCFGGICIGKVISNSAGVVSQLRAFGEAPGLATLVTFPREDRAVFARTGRLTLVGLDGTEATVLDDVAMSPAVRSDSIGIMVWAFRPRTFLIPVLEHYLAIVSVNRGIDLFDLSGDKLKPSQRYGFGSHPWPINAAAGAGARLFVCTPYEVQVWSIDATTLYSVPGATLSLPAGHECQGLALSPDGNALYAATTKGLLRIKVAAMDGSMLLDTSAREGKLVIDVQVNGKYVAIYEIRDIVSGAGDVTVLSVDSLAEVTSFLADLSPTGTFPTGFSLLDADRLLLQTARNDASTGLVNTAATMSLSAAPFELDRRVMAQTFKSPYGTFDYHTVAGGSHAAIEPMHQLVRIDPVTAALTTIPSPRQGSFEYVRADGPNTVLAYGPGSVQRIDISNPLAPQVLAGGTESPLDLEWLRLDVSNLAAPKFVTASSIQLDPLVGPVTTLLTSDSAGLPRHLGSIANADPNAVWLASGDRLFQLAQSGTTDFRLCRFSGSQVTMADGQTLTPELDQLLATNAPTSGNFRFPPKFSRDANNGDIVILETRSNSSVSNSNVAELSAYSESASQFTRRYSVALDPGIATSVAAANGRSVVIIDYRPTVVDRDGNRLSFLANINYSVEGVLAFDEKKLVLAASWNSPTTTEGVIILRADDFSEIARYATGEPILSMAEVGNYLVFGAKSSISIATPACSGN